MAGSHGRHTARGEIEEFRTAGPVAGSANGELYARISAVAGVSAFVTTSIDRGLAIEWVDPQFARITGFEPEYLIGRHPGILNSTLPDPLDADVLNLALARGEPARQLIHTMRRDGDETWTEISIAPIRDESGEVVQWLWTNLDLTSYLRPSAEAIREGFGTQRSTIDIVGRATDLLTNVDRPHTLRNVAELLTGGVVRWCGFYLNDQGLRYSESVDASAPPSGRGQRHGRFAPGNEQTPGTVPRSVLPTDALGDSIKHADAQSTQPPAIDRVQEVLDGSVEDPVTLLLDDTYPRWSASGWLVRDLADRLPHLDRPIDRVRVYPVHARHEVFGVLVALLDREAVPPTEEVPRPTDQAEEVLSLMARRAGGSIDNLRLYAQEHQLAETLQRAMLPEQADIPTLDVWTYYAPASEHAQVGGDWYDVLPVADDVIGLVIGDVVGHDIEAAAAMGQLRLVVRSYALELSTPGAVLERVDQLINGMHIPRSASMVYGILSRPDAPVEESSAEDISSALDALDTPTAAKGIPTRWSAQLEPEWVFEYSRAGHLPPLLLRGGTAVSLGEANGPLVGFGSGARPTARVSIFPGDVLVLYTDGLIERRDRSLRAGLAALTKTGTGITATDAAGVGEELLSRLADAPEDDLALVIVRIPDPASDDSAHAPSPRARRWILPSEPASIGRARHAVVRTCAAWDIAESANAELVVSELVANGVLHGWGRLALRLFDTGEGLQIEVEDANPSPPVPTEGHPNRSGGFGMQIVARLADWGWHPAGTGKVVWAKIRPSKPSR